MPSLSRTPARSIEPAVGASVWASGSQVWNGKTGVFTMKAMAKPRNSHAAPVLRDGAAVDHLEQVEAGLPPSPAPARMASVTIDTSMKAEPNIVKRKNLVAA